MKHVDGASCPRCGGTRLLHVTRVVDSTPRFGDHIGGTLTHAWMPRPVAVVRSAEQPTSFVYRQRNPSYNGEWVEPVGRFETIVCRRCGHTGWWAFDWQGVEVPTRPNACRCCASVTPHADLPAVEGGGSGYEDARLTHGMLGREGFLRLSICRPCGLVGWRARGWTHVSDRYGVHRFRDEPQRPCLECHGTRALVVSSAREYDGERMPVTVHDETVLHFFHLARAEGRFLLRVCAGCDAVEWYAERLDEVKVDPAQGVFELGVDPVMRAAGPYR